MCLQGQGVLTDVNGNTSKGVWEDGKKEGMFTETYKDNSLFEGQFKNNLKNGYGMFNWADGSVYKGEFVNDNINGKGSIFFC